MVGRLFRNFQRASITKYISYCQERLPRQQAMEIIREIDTAGNFNQDTLAYWKEWMSEHNRIVERGERMMLLQGRKTNMNWIKFWSLDLFMLQMRSGYMAELLNDFSRFGERVLQLIEASPNFLFWGIGGQIVVERTRWCRLCAHVMTLLHVLGVADSSARPQRTPWPDRDLLEAAATRARGVFGRFACADISTPAVRAAPFRHPQRAEPRRRAPARRREDSAPASLPPRVAVSDSTAGPPRGLPC
jgi:hypothetical protein